jgi:hypothetical protein
MNVIKTLVRTASRKTGRNTGIKIAGEPLRGTGGGVTG